MDERTASIMKPTLGAKAVILDVPVEEYKLHNDPTKSPGIVPAKYIKGVINVNPGDPIRVYKRSKLQPETENIEVGAKEDIAKQPRKREQNVPIPGAEENIPKKDEDVW